MEEAMFLSRFASEVVIAHRRDSLRASKPMQQRVTDNPTCSFLWNTEVVDCIGEVAEGGLTGLVLKDTLSGERRDYEVNGLFLAIGHTPNTEFVGDLLAKDDAGYLLHVADSSKTAIAGVFVCGDVTDHVYRQAVTAAGSGCMAAIDAERWLEAEHRG
jgi:thioredoxin reductase (NADPH)